MRSLLLTICVLFGINANSQETKTSIGFSLTPNFSSIYYVDDGSYPLDYIDYLKLYTKGSIGLSGNVFFQYEVTDKLFITWGLGVQNYRYSRMFFSQAPLDHIVYTTKTYSQYYLQLNTSVKYRIHKTLYVRVGIGVDVLAEPRVKSISSEPSENYKGDDNTNFKEAMIPISLGVGYELKLTDRLNLMAELFGTMIVTDALDSAPNTSVLQRKPWQLGFSIGVIRSF